MLHNGTIRMSRNKQRRRATGGIRGTLMHLFHPSYHNEHKPKLLHPESLLYFSLIVLASFSLLKAIRFFPGIEHSILGYASNITPEDVIIQTNKERTTNGMGGLILNEELSQAALAKGQDMFADQYWSHTAPDGTEPWYFIEKSGYSYKVAGENLARDFMNTSDMMQAWLASPTHRANLLNPRFQEIGIAVIDGRLNGFETTLVVQMFGTPEKTANIATKPTEKKTPQLLTDAAETNTTQEKTGTEAVLADSTMLVGQAVSPMEFRDAVLLTPLQLTKAFFLAVILLVVMTLTYDTFIASNTKTAHLIGKNIGHLMIFSAVAFMLIFFKGGMVN